MNTHRVGERARNGGLVVVRACLEEAVECPEEPTEQRSIKARSNPLARRANAGNLAASAGDKVSELIAEITVEIAIVTANCL